MKRLLGLATALLLGTSVLGISSIAAADVVTDWNSTIRSVAQHDGTNAVNKANPGWSTRAMAMTNGAIYDAFQAIDRTHVPYLYNPLAGANTSLPAAVHQAAYELLVDSYPGETGILDADYNARMALIPGGVEKTNGMDLGHSIAQAYIANRTGDGADQGMSYLPQAGPGKWRPDPYNPGQVAWGPQWGTVTPFAIGDTTPFVQALPPIPALDSAAYTAAFNQVKDYGRLVDVAHATPTSRTADEEAMGLFWAYDRPAMGPPPVLFVRNLEEIAAQTGNTPEENARLFAMASVAMADAAIAAWDAKYQYNFWRPVAAIQEAGVGGAGDADGNPDTVGDPTWKPLGAPGGIPGTDTDDFTPPFPAWTSGHATMGGAVFKAIELFYGTNSFDQIDGILGNDTLYTLTSQEAGSGSARDFDRFTQTGLMDVGTENSPEGENGMSRIYLGIHWIFDQEDGIALGNDIAEYVNGNYFQPVPEPGTFVLAGLGGLTLLAITVRRRIWRMGGTP